MYLLTLDKVSDPKILKNIYTNIDCFNLDGHTFIVYNLDLTNGFNFNSKMMCHVISVDLRDLVHYNEDQVEDIILDLITTAIPVAYSNIELVDTSLLNMVKLLSDTHKLKYTLLWKGMYSEDIDLVNLSYNDIEIVKEIFGCKCGESAMNSTDFLYRFTVKSDGCLYDDYTEQLLSNLCEVGYYEAIQQNSILINTIIHKEMDEYFREKILSNYFYEPWIFLLHKDVTVINQLIQEYKLKIFNSIKNIDPEDYPRMNSEIISLMNKTGYIKMNDILEIVENTIR